MPCSLVLVPALVPAPAVEGRDGSLLTRSSRRLTLYCGSAAGRVKPRGNAVMTAERIKVRCYRCNQLLGVPPSKAGAIVACPKCKAELLIPSPEAEDGAPGPGAAAVRSPAPKPTAQAPPSQAPPSFLEGIDTGIPPEVADLRPEDLRVEAEFFETLTREPPAPAGPGPFSAPWPGSEPPLSPPPEESSRLRSAPDPGFWPAATAVGPAPVESPPPPPIPASQPTEDIPPIEIEPPSILPPGAEVRRVREVVLPASVVLAWSLFVLAGIAMSFLAGLLIGHFLWKTIP